MVSNTTIHLLFPICGVFDVEAYKDVNICMAYICFQSHGHAVPALLVLILAQFVLLKFLYSTSTPHFPHQLIGDFPTDSK